MPALPRRLKCMLHISQYALVCMRVLAYVCLFVCEFFRHCLLRYRFAGRSFLLINIFWLLPIGPVFSSVFSLHLLPFSCRNDYVHTMGVWLEAWHDGASQSGSDMARQKRLQI